LPCPCPDLQTKLTQARHKAEAIANQEDVPMKSKMREIEKLYSQVGWGDAACSLCQAATRRVPCVSEACAKVA
jgi:hypothetical protein